MKKVIVIVGPTAIGKTKLSVMLAKAINGEIISGDSVSVYKKLNIGSAKVTSEEMDGVEHHLINVIEPDEQYTVFDFQKLSRVLIDQINVPIIVGGTGLYIKAALYDYDFSAPKRDVESLAKYSDLDNEQLHQVLEKLDYRSSLNIHKNNRKRVLRAIETAESACLISDNVNKDVSLYNPYIIYLNVDREILYQRINQRVLKMFDDGLEREVYDLYQKGIKVNAIGYKEFYPYFEGEISREAVVELIQKNSRHLAKKQITWFKHQMNTNFYEVNLNDIDETFNLILKDVNEFLGG